MAMRKKGFEPDLSISVLLTVPENGELESLAREYLQKKYPNSKLIFLNTTEENLPIELIRTIIQQESYGRGADESIIYVFCAADKASLPAQNALLKILEEPPANIGFALVKTQGSNILATITSRCQEINLSKIKNNENLNLPEHLETTLEFCLNPASKNYGELINLAEQWSKSENKEKELTKVIKILLENKHKTVFTLKSLSTALDSWQKNGNVKLVIEHCFFTIKQHSH